MPLSTPLLRKFEEFHSKLQAYSFQVLRGSPPDSARQELRILYGELKSELASLQVPTHWEQGGRYFPIFEVALEPYDPRTYRIYQKAARLAVASAEEAIGRARDRDLPKEAWRVLQDIQTLRAGLVDYAQLVESGLYKSTRQQRPDLLRQAAMVTPSLEDLGLETTVFSQTGQRESLFQLALAELIKVPSGPVKNAFDQVLELLGRAEARLREMIPAGMEIQAASGEESAGAANEVTGAHVTAAAVVLQPARRPSTLWYPVVALFALAVGWLAGRNEPILVSTFWSVVDGWQKKSGTGRAVLVAATATLAVSGSMLASDLREDGWRAVTQRRGVIEVILVLVSAAVTALLAVHDRLY
jgi:hypothetical protein